MSLKRVKGTCIRALRNGSWKIYRRMIGCARIGRAKGLIKGPAGRLAVELIGLCDL